jgi:hypothetical protein
VGTADAGDAPETSSSGASADEPGRDGASNAGEPERVGSEHAASGAGVHAGAAVGDQQAENASMNTSVSTSVGTERAHVRISLGRGRTADLDADDVSFDEDPADGPSVQDARAPDALSVFWAASDAVDRSNAAAAGDGDDGPPDTWFDPSLSDDADDSAESDDTDDSAESSDAAPDAAARGAVVRAPRVTPTPE